MMTYHSDDEPRRPGKGQIRRHMIIDQPARHRRHDEVDTGLIKLALLFLGLCVVAMIVGHFIKL